MSQVSDGQTDAFALVTGQAPVLPLFPNNDDTLSVYADRFAAGYEIYYARKERA